MVRRSNTKPSLQESKGIGQMRERDGDSKWFPIEFQILYDSGKFKRFGYVRKQDGGEIADGHYFFLDDLGERKSRWRKWKGEWQIGWRCRQ